MNWLDTLDPGAPWSDVSPLYQGGGSTPQKSGFGISPNDPEYASKMRAQIAREMWADYKKRFEPYVQELTSDTFNPARLKDQVQAALQGVNTAYAVTGGGFVERPDYASPAPPSAPPVGAQPPANSPGTPPVQGGPAPGRPIQVVARGIGVPRKPISGPVIQSPVIRLTGERARRLSRYGLHPDAAVQAQFARKQDLSEAGAKVAAANTARANWLNRSRGIAIGGSSGLSNLLTQGS